MSSLFGHSEIITGFQITLGTLEDDKRVYQFKWNPRETMDNILHGFDCCADFLLPRQETATVQDILNS